MQITSTPAIAANAAKCSADLLAESTIYTANVGGKTFTADINFSAGQYVATIPDYCRLPAADQRQRKQSGPGRK
jgi:hypothetical protein